MTHLEISDRLDKHNNQFYGTKYTSKAQDWQIFIVIECSSVSQAIHIERHIKSMKSKVYIENLRKHPEMTQKLLERY
jgi:putative endonuclease